MTTAQSSQLEIPLTFALPTRDGTPPQVTNGVPHVQLDQTSSDEILQELVQRTFAIQGVIEEPSRASQPGAKALTVAPDRPTRQEALIIGREFGHIHPKPNGAGSLHLRLAPDDATLIVDQGWGEYHPFALDGTIPNLVMVYSPQTTQDLNVVMTIIEEAVTYAIDTE